MKFHTTKVEGIVNNQAEVRVSSISAFCGKHTLIQMALIVAGCLVITLVAIVVLIVVTKGKQKHFFCPFFYSRVHKSLQVKIFA